MATATIDGRPFTVMETMPYLVYSVANGAESTPFATREAAEACLNAIREARFPAEKWPEFDRDENECPWLFVAGPGEYPGEHVYRLVK